MKKFQATYRITIYSNQDTVIIGAHEEKDENGNTVLVQDPAKLSCQFNVTRETMSDSNKCTLQIKNLAPSTRERIFQDVFTIDPMKWKYLKLEAGYGQQLPMIFWGRIRQAYSYKSGGQTDVITEIQAQALDIFDCQSSHTFEAGTTFKEAAQRLAADLPNVTLANCGELEGTFKTRTTFDGSTLEQLNKLTGGHSYVDCGMLNILMNNEVLDVPVPVITDENGLLETPRRRDANLEVKMLFEPTLIVGQLLEIKSRNSPNFNGQYKVLGFTHDCLISGSEAGSRTTSVNLWIAPFLPDANITTTGNQTSNGVKKVKGFKIESVLTFTPDSARDTYRYIQAHNGKLPNTWITNKISWKDMLGHNNTEADRLKECTLAICSNAFYTATKLEGTLNAILPGRKFKITSGWRSVRNNKSCGGAAKSRHLYGLAVDFVIDGLRVNQYSENFSQAWDGWTKNEGTWMHAQTEPTKRKANDK